MIKYVESKLQLDEVKVIHHISDIHIRNYKRHQEYNYVFDNLYTTLKSKVKDGHLIVLTGDIVHSKTDVTPELFNETQKFFSSLCDIAPVLMIPGNHDANLNNSHRMDALTPIVNALNNPRLEYAKDSVIVRLGNLDFYHWSVFDQYEQYPKPEEDCRTKICLFHGAVNTSTTEIGFVIENENMKISSFSGFDMVLLGDIHKPQFLNEDKTIAYPGSLIQQNHGEELDHGYLLWDLENKKIDIIKIENNTAFYTLDIDSGLYTSIDSNLPKNLYLRIKYKNTDQAILRDIVNEIKKTYNVVELTTQRVNEFTSRDSTFISSRGLDFRSVAQQNDLISNFVKHKYTINQNEIDKILDINLEINKNIKKNEIPRNSMWIPKRFEFENMFSYGKNNHVDFTDMKGTFGLFAPNASGKSTLLDSLTYCLFDKCSKTSRGNQVLNSNSDTFYCKLNFELNGLDYYIERNARRQSSGNVRVEVDFYYLDKNSEKVSLNGKDRSDTNLNIRNLLGTYEDFILTTLSTQSNNTGFIDMNQKDRKDLLSQFMDIGVFEELYNQANEVAKDTAAVLRHYQKTDYETVLRTNENQLQNKIDFIKIKLESKHDLTETKQKLSEKILDLNKDLVPIDNSIIDETYIKQTIGDCKSDIEQFETKYSKIDSHLQTVIDTTNKLKEKTILIDEEKLKLDIENSKTLHTQFHSIDIECQKLENHISHKVEKSGKLNQLEYDPNCKYCMNNVFVKDAIQVKSEITTDKAKLEILKQRRSDLQIQVQKYRDLETEKQAYDSDQKSISKLESESAFLTIDLLKIKAKISEKQNEITNCENKLELRKNQVSTIEKNKSLQFDISVIKERLNKVEKDLSELDKQISDLSVEIKILEKSILDTKNEIAKRKQLEADYQYYQYYLEATHRDGIPHDIISVMIPKIQEEVNNILSQLVDFKIIFETDDKNINAYIAYSEDKFWPLEMTSGMEKFISSLAIRTSLINVSTLPRPNFIAIDEGFGSLDKFNLGSMSMLFEYLKTQFKFLFIISHIDSMRDIVDSHIEIQKVSGRSLVKHG